MDSGERTFLRTLGHPVLRRGDGSVVEGLRRKDLALLAYLCVEGDRPFSRAHLAALLWGESPEERARHSLTQTLRRAAAGVGRGALVMERDTVRWTGGTCDAQLLLEGDARLDELLTLYEGPFLEGFEAGFGSQDFSTWADARRAELRRAAVRWLDRMGERAERENDWPRALRIGERSVQVDREWEGGHRRVMRALLERGERNLALRHFREFARWLTYEVGGHPDPETVALADLIRATASFPPTPPAAAATEGVIPLSPPAGEETSTVDAAGPAPRLVSGRREEAEAPTDRPADAAESAGPDVRPILPARHCEGETDAGEGTGSVPPSKPIDAGEEADREHAHAAPDTAATVARSEDQPITGTGVDGEAGAEGAGHARRTAGMSRVSAARGIVVLGLVAALAAGMWAARPWARSEVAVGPGEVIRAGGGGPPYLVVGDTLYAFPDAATLDRCLGRWPRVRRVRSLPAWPRRTLPSVKSNDWLGELGTVTALYPGPSTRYISVGCVLAPILDTLSLKTVSGRPDWWESARAPESLLQRMPRTSPALPFPVRPPGALIRGAGDSIRWVAYHGGALAVRDSAVLGTYCRTAAEAVRVREDEFRYYRSSADLPPASVPCRRRNARGGPARLASAARR